MRRRGKRRATKRRKVGAEPKNPLERPDQSAMDDKAAMPLAKRRKFEDEQDEEHELPGDSVKDGESKPRVQIYDFCCEILWKIVEQLEVGEVLSLAKCHPNLLGALKEFPNKGYNRVQWGVDRVAEILLADAWVESLDYSLHLDTKLNIKVGTVNFQGEPADAYKCAALIESWEPWRVSFPKWGASVFRFYPDLARLLKDISYIGLFRLPIRWLSEIPEWNLTCVDLKIATGGKDIVIELANVFRALCDQWISFQRSEFCLQIYVKDSPLALAEVLHILAHDGYALPIVRRDRCRLTYRHFLNGLLMRGHYPE
ncbi:unnamed protein product, partial [Mesorhabditis spiculigera]